MFGLSCSRSLSQDTVAPHLSSASSHSPFHILHNPLQKDRETEARRGLESQRGGVERAERPNVGTELEVRRGQWEQRRSPPIGLPAHPSVLSYVKSLPLEEGLAPESGCA